MNPPLDAGASDVERARGRASADEEVEGPLVEVDADAVAGRREGRRAASVPVAERTVRPGRDRQGEGRLGGKLSVVGEDAGGEGGAVVEAGVVDDPRVERVLAEVIAEDGHALRGRVTEIVVGAGEDHAAACIGDDVGMLGLGGWRSEEAGGAGGDQSHQQPTSGRDGRACGACRDIHRETPFCENVNQNGECEHQGRFQGPLPSVQRLGRPLARRSCRGERLLSSGGARGGAPSG